MTTKVETDQEREARLAKKREAEKARRERKRLEAAGSAVDETRTEAVLSAARKLTAGTYFESRFRPEDVAAMIQIIDGRDPIEFAFDGAPDETPKNHKKVLADWLGDAIPSGDPVARHLNRMSRRVRSDERTPQRAGVPDIWGRKVAALLLALSETAK